jgi:hypothetical protein
MTPFDALHYVPFRHELDSYTWPKFIGIVAKNAPDLFDKNQAKYLPYPAKPKIETESFVPSLPGYGKIVEHPVLGERYRLQSVIMNLNDKCGWTRDQIADWLETLDLDLRFLKEEIDV